MRSARKYGSAVICLFMALVLIIAPYNIQLEKGRLNIERNDAEAIAPAFAGAYAFLTEMAIAGGFASASDLIVTVAGCTAITSGMTVGTSAGINFGNSIGDNLDALIDAADYPSWDTLSSSEQTAWGSKDNYNAAKFNELMAAYGMGPDYERYQQTWGSFTPGEFQFSSSANDTLEQLHSICQNWINGVGNAIGNVIGLGNKQDILSWAPLAQDVYTADPNDSEWPSTVNRTIYYQVNTGYTYKYTYRNNVQIISWETSSPVSIFSYYEGGYYKFLMFSKQSFQAKNVNWSDWNNATSDSSNGRQVYYFSNTHYAGTNVENSASYNGVMSFSNNSSLIYVLANILYGESQTIDHQIADYPEEDIENGDLDNVLVVIPEDGISDDTNWDDLLQKISDISDDLRTLIGLVRHIDSDLHQFNFYSNGDLKVHDQGVFNELSDMYLLLMEISSKIVSSDVGDSSQLIGDFDFDDLAEKVPDLLEVISDIAPFGAVALLSEIYGIASQIGVIQDPTLTVPFEFGLENSDLEIEIDLSWLDDIRPVINFSLILTLIFGLTWETVKIVELEAS